MEILLSHMRCCKIVQLINDGNVWTATSILSMFINMQNLHYCFPISFKQMTCLSMLNYEVSMYYLRILHILSIYDARYACSCYVNVCWSIMQCMLYMLHMPSIDACYTCHQFVTIQCMFCVFAINSIYNSIINCWDMLRMLSISAAWLYPLDLW